MKKKNVGKRIISVVLSLVMIFSIAVPAMAEDKAESTTKYHYVSIGSSQTNGYGLHGYVNEKFYQWNGSKKQTEEWNKLYKEKGYNWQDSDEKDGLDAWSPTQRFDVSVSGYKVEVEGSWPVLVKNYLKENIPNEYEDVEFDQLALSSMRAEELYMLLDDSYYGDKFTSWRFYDEDEEKGGQWFLKDGGLEELRRVYQKSLKEADLITYDLGANNFGAYFANQVADPDKFTTDLTNIFGDKVDWYYSIRSKIETKLQKLVGKDNLSDDTLLMLNNVVDTMAYATCGYCVYFDKTMEWLEENNSDAQVIVVGIQNASDGDYVYLNDGEIKLGLGDLMAIPINIANSYASKYSSNRSYYKYVCPGSRATIFMDTLRSYEGPDDLTQDMKDCLNVYDNHVFMKQFFTHYIEKKHNDIKVDSEKYNKVLDNVYDYMYRTLRYVESTTKVDFTSYISGKGDYDNVSNYLFNTENYRELADKYYDGNYEFEDYSAMAQFIEAAIKKYENSSGELDKALEKVKAGCDALDSNDKGQFAIELWYNFGNSFFAHPNREGHEELAEKVENAISFVHVHSMKRVKYKAPTCAENGNRSYYTCTTCNKNYRDISGLHEIKNLSEVTLTSRHVVTYLPKVRATYLHNGHIACYYCSKCGKFFSDKNCTKELTEEEVVLKYKK